MRTALLSLLSLMLLAACGSPSGNEASESDNLTVEEKMENELWDQIMEVHDAVMPKTSDLERTAKALKKHLDRPDLTEAQRQEVKETIQLIESAVDAMYTWMNDLKMLPDLRKNQNHEQIMTYLRTEYNNISTVKALMEEALEKGERLLQILEPQKTNEQ